MDKLLELLPGYQEQLFLYRETILANVAMISEIPSPTFGEQNRIRFLCNRFSECGLHNCSTDEKGNGFGILPGKQSKRNILLVAHADTLFPEQTDHTVTIHTDQIVGPGLGDNSLGVAVIALLPTLLEKLDIQLNSNLILMGSVHGLGRGDLEGLRFFLHNNKMPIEAGVCIEGVELGRLSYTSLGMMRGEISCVVPEEYDWLQFGASSAIITLNDVISKINQIPIPRRPRTAILLSSIQGGGTSYNRIAKRASLRFEVRSESAEIVEDIEQQVKDITAEMVFQTEANLSFHIFARRYPGGISYRHPLVEITRSIMRTLNLKPWITPSISELSAFIDHQIPAITLGISKSSNKDEMDETVLIEPIFSGIAQLIGVIQAIDSGVCNEAK